MKFQRIKQLIQEDELGTALKQLQEMIKEPELANELIISTANFHALQSDIRKGIIGFENATLEENRIRNTVLEIINAAENGTVLTAVAPPLVAAPKRPASRRYKWLTGIGVLLVFLYWLGSIEEPPEGPPSEEMATMNFVDIPAEPTSSYTTSVKTNEAATTKMTFRTLETYFEEPLQGDPALGTVSCAFSFQEPVDFPDPDILEKVSTQVYEDFFETDSLLGSFEANANYLKGFHFRLAQYLHSESTATDEPQEERKTYVSSVFYNKNNVLTIKIEMTENFSGKSPIRYRTYYSYNLRTGDRIIYDDIFQTNVERGLSKKLTERLIELSGAETQDELKDLGYWNNSLPPTQNFYFTEAGICFVYLPYELADHISKENTVCFFFEELDVFLSKPFPLPQLLE